MTSFTSIFDVSSRHHLLPHLDTLPHLEVSPCFRFKSFYLQLPKTFFNISISC